MAEKKAKQSELEKFSGFAELALRKKELSKKRAGLKSDEAYFARNTANTYAERLVGEKPVEPCDVSPVFDIRILLLNLLGILLIVAPIILFIIAVNMQSTSVDSDPMGLYTIVFFLIIAAFIFVKRCFEEAGELFQEYKSDFAIHKEYPVKKSQYDAALAKWNREYTTYKNKFFALKAENKKDLEALEEELSNLETQIGEEYDKFWFKFDDEASLTINDKLEIIEDNSKVRTFGRVKNHLIRTKESGAEEKVPQPEMEDEYQAIFDCWVSEGKVESFCAPLAELIKQRLEENKKAKILKVANEILDELYDYVNAWRTLIDKKRERRFERELEWELCNSCWKLYGGQRECPMAPRRECAAYSPK